MDENLSVTSETVGGGICVLRVSGPINVNTFDKLETAIQGLFDAGRYNIVLELGGVNYISSAGAGVLMNAYLHSQDHHGRVVLIGMSHGVHEIFELLNLREVIPTAKTLQDALAGFPQK